MKTITIKAETPEELDSLFEKQMQDFKDRQKLGTVQIGITNIGFSTHTENDKTVYCNQIQYVEQSKIAVIGGGRNLPN